MDERFHERQDHGEETDEGLWSDLEQAVEQERESTLDLWETLGERLDISRRKPKHIAHAEVAAHQTAHGEEYYVLKHLEGDTYLRLDARDYFLWELMDGQHSIRDLAVAYSARYGTFPFERLIRLVEKLKENGFLEEKPVHVFGAIVGRFAARSWVYRLKRFSETFAQKEFSLKNVDRFFEILYRWGGWIFFTRPVAVLCAILFLAGLILFGLELATGTYSLTKTGESYGLGLLTLTGLIYLVIVCHECGHALAVKHYRRKVLRAGMLIYYGRPSFFVDTTDIWMAPKQARLVVSFAGPCATLLFASLCSVFIPIIANSALNAVLFKVAFICYTLVLLIVNPLLELDGYYILMDWLEIPLLRKKSLDFVKRRLWERLFRERRRFSREERVFAVFGVLATACTGFFIILGVYLWETNIATMIRELRSGQDLLSTFLMAGMLILIGTPFVVGLALRVVFFMGDGFARARVTYRRRFRRE